MPWHYYVTMIDGVRSIGPRSDVRRIPHPFLCALGALGGSNCLFAVPRRPWSPPAPRPPRSPSLPFGSTCSLWFNSSTHTPPSHPWSRPGPARRIPHPSLCALGALGGSNCLLQFPTARGLHPRLAHRVPHPFLSAPSARGGSNSLHTPPRRTPRTPKRSTHQSPLWSFCFDVGSGCGSTRRAIATLGGRGPWGIRPAEIAVAASPYWLATSSRSAGSKRV